MSDIALPLLSASIPKVLENQLKLGEDVREIKSRLGRLETERFGLQILVAEQSARIDSLAHRCDLSRQPQVPLESSTSRRRSRAGFII